MSAPDISAYRDLYLTTARRYAEGLLQNLGGLTGVRPDRAAMDSVLIPAHSLKSQSYVMGYLRTGRLAAMIEKRLTALKNDANSTLTAADTKALLDAARGIADSLTSIESQSAESVTDGMIGDYERQLGVHVDPLK